MVIDDSEFKFDGETAEAVRASLQALLARNALKLSDVFREMDDDMSGVVGYATARRTRRPAARWRARKPHWRSGAVRDSTDGAARCVAQVRGAQARV